MISQIARGATSVIKKIPSLNNFKKFFNLEDIPNQKMLNTLVDDYPYAVKELEFIDASLSNKNITDSLSHDSVKNALTFTPNNIRKVYQDVDIESKASRVVEDLDIFNNINDKITEADGYLTTRFRGLDLEVKELQKYFSNNITERLKKRGVAELDAFSRLVKNPKVIEETYGVSQRQLFSYLSGKSDFQFNELQKPLKNMIDELKIWDQEIVKYLQDYGVPIGDLDDFGLSLAIPKSAINDLGEDVIRQSIRKNVVIKKQGRENLISKLKKRADDTSEYGGINFLSRNLRFKSPDHEINFFMDINSMTDKDSLLNGYLRHKENIVKRGLIVNQFGSDPVRTVNRIMSKLKDKAKGNLDQINKLNKLQKNFKKQYDVFSGGISIDNHTIENIRLFTSSFLSLITGAPAVSTLRNLTLDFNLNLGATGAAIYNPKYTLGDSALGFAQDVSELVKYGIQSVTGTNKPRREWVNNILRSMKLANNYDSYNHVNLLSFEDIYDVAGKSSKDNFMKPFVDKMQGINNTLYTISGQNYYYDFRRARHLITFQNLWTNNLDSFSYKEWRGMLTPIQNKQLDYLKYSIGIGENEYAFLQKVKRLKLDEKDSMNIITRDSILETKDELARKFIRSDETIDSFKKRVAGSWQRLIHLSTLDAAPIPVFSDSISKNFANSSSMVRLLMMPLLKFGDITQSQWNKVTERVSLISKGNMEGMTGFDKSLLLYTKVFMTYLGGGIGMKWSNDLLNGREPTDFRDHRNIEQALLSSGFLGYFSFIISNILNSYPSRSDGIHSFTPISRISDAAIRLYREKDSKQFSYHMFDEVRKMTGIGNLWYARGLVNSAMQEALLTESEQKSISRKKERYTKQRKRKVDKFYKKLF